MKREFLEGFGLDKEAVDKIMSANGDDIQNARQSEAQKFTTERDGLNQQISELTRQAETRDADLKSLNEKLTAASADAGKLKEAQDALTAAQNKYAEDKKAWETETTKRAYESAVRLASAGLKFSSSAARKTFEQDAIAAGLKMDKDGALLGFNDYAEKYRESDPGAFASEEPPKPAAPVPTPSVVTGTNSGNNTPVGPNKLNLHFTAVRKIE